MATKCNCHGDRIMQRLFAMRAVVVGTGCHGERILIVAIGTGICHEGNSCHGDRMLQSVYVRVAHRCKKSGCLGDSKMNIGF